MKIICDYCGKEFRRKTCKSEYERYPHHFCSHRCVGKWRGEHGHKNNWDKVSYRKIDNLRRLTEMIKQDKIALRSMF